MKIKFNKEKRFEHKERSFLCKEVDSYCATQITIQKHEYTEGVDPSCWGDIKIADCYRSVSLSFSADGKGFNKLNTLISHLLKFRDNLEEAQTWLENNKQEKENVF